MLRTQIYLPENQIVLMKQRAAEMGVSLSSLIRQYLEEKLQMKKPKMQTSTHWLLMLAHDAKKKKIRGPKDLAQNAEKYLYE
jgi:hypothetical protein